ncbi:MAG: transposase [Deltaproteobacteria bacterium]|nr:transposase [Deltaproteobacteria bacterium]
MYLIRCINDSFIATLERVKTGVFHFMSRKHLSRYLAEMSFC